VDFFARQEAARRTTRWLVGAFLLSVVAIIAIVDALVVFMLRASHSDYPPEHVVVMTTVLVAGIVLGGTLFKSFLLRAGGSAVARSLGGTRVDRNSSDPPVRRLRNVVEEMAIASGVAAPEIYVLEDEDSINAFAAGNSPADAVVAVTRGALRRLNREELQGVIGHEFSHVLNGDMRLNVKLMGLTFGLLVLAIVGRTILRLGPHRGRNRDGGGAMAALMVAALALLILGYIGVFFGQLMQAAVSRRREQLADASAVQFTRNPGGLRNALLKIAAHTPGSRLVTPHVDEAAHMLFAPGIDRAFATHPPLVERIAALDPAFKPEHLGALTAEARRQSEQMLAAAAALEREVNERAELGDVSQPTAPAARKFIENVAQLAIASHVGEIDPRQVRHAEELRRAIPQPLRDFADSPDHARALLLSVLASDDAGVLERQRAIIESAYGGALMSQVLAHKPTASTLDPMLRLPAVLQLFPTLRRLTPAERTQLAEVAEELAAADARIDVFECCLSLLLAANIEEGLHASPPHGSRTLLNTASAIHTLFAVLAAHGADDEAEARRAYEAGISTVLPQHRPPYARLANWPGSLRTALGELKLLQPFAKRVLIDGMVRTIALDDRMSTEEAEILRTVCALLHCPLPPILGIQAAPAG
jgi:Zn-dependent protease with chaperone function